MLERNVKMKIGENIKRLQDELSEKVTLVAVSKTHSNETILEAYNSGHRTFGENKVQELLPKYEALPKDIEWHLIGHLQSNKVKFIAPFVSLIHSVDSFRLLREIDKQGERNGRVIHCLLQVHIADEESKFGLSVEELHEILKSPDLANLSNVSIDGLMGMATFTEDMDQVRKEFKGLATIYKDVKATYFANNPQFHILSMGMSGDYRVAVEEGSNLVRIGSLIFGERE